MGATVVSDDNRCLRFLRRHPNLDLALVPALAGVYLLFICWMVYGPLEFSATVSRYEGLDLSRRAEAGAPRFGVTLRARNRNVWQHCFKPSSAVVAYAGVPLARADLPGFCVPGRGVAKVRFVAAGEDGLGLPDALYERLETQRRRRERVPLTVRVRLDEEHVVPHNLQWPMLLWCAAMLDGHPPDGPSRCTAFSMWER